MKISKLKIYAAMAFMSTTLFVTVPAEQVNAQETKTESVDSTKDIETTNVETQNTETTNVESQNTETTTSSEENTNTEEEKEGAIMASDSANEEQTLDTTSSVEKKEFGKDEYIDEDNWSQELDKDEHAGEIIDENAEGFRTEKTAKGIEDETPTPTPTPEPTPTPTPTPNPTPDTPSNPIPEIVYVPTETPTETKEVPKMGEDDEERYKEYLEYAAAVAMALGTGALFYFDTKKKKTK